MEHKHAIVIDSKGYKITFVLAAVTFDDGQLTAAPLDYDLQPGETLIFDAVQQALGMVKPRWHDKKGWQETATKKELEAAQAPPEGWEQAAPEPDPRDLALAELAELMAANQAQTDLALAEIVQIITGG